MALNLSKEWKQGLALDDPQPFALIENLYDLLFVDIGGVTYARSLMKENGVQNIKGLTLEHNIIVFDPTVYGEMNGGCREILKSDTDSFNYWNKTGFDVAVPVLDARSRPMFFNADVAAEELEDGYDDDVFTKLIASLKPNLLNKSDYYYSKQASTATYAPGFKIYEEDAIIPFKNTKDVYRHSCKMGSVSTYEDDWADYSSPYGVALATDSFNSNADIILVKTPERFKTRFSSELNYNVFNTLCFNFESNTVWKNFISYYGLSCTASTIKAMIYTDSVGACTFNESSSSTALQYLLKHCYVILKCAFLADPVDYTDFAQNLNPESDVVHRNIIISGKGDFHRYEDEVTYADGAESTTSDSTTRPYIPKTTPVVDLLSDEFTSGSSIEEKVATLIAESVKPDSDIGSLPSSPLVGKGISDGVTSKTSTALPPGWFDPSSRNDATDYTDMPAVMPKTGNGVFDGRLIGPTIDEINYIIKQILGGRAAESNTQDEIGYPGGTGNNTDTRITIKEHTFKSSSGGNVKGDPLYIKWTEGANGLTYSVQKWIDNPSKFTYSLVQAIKDFQATLKETPTITVYESKPNDTVYSLRELEALIRGLQYNLEYAVTLLSKSFATVDGGITQFNSDSDLGTLEWTSDPDETNNKEIYLSKNGTWQSVRQFMRIRVREDEDY